jgi:hypothetical protein
MRVLLPLPPPKLSPVRTEKGLPRQAQTPHHVSQKRERLKCAP